MQTCMCSSRPLHTWVHEVLQELQRRTDARRGAEDALHVEVAEGQRSFTDVFEA